MSRAGVDLGVVLATEFAPDKMPGEEGTVAVEVAADFAFVSSVALVTPISSSTAPSSRHFSTVSEFFLEGSEENEGSSSSFIF